MSDAKKESQIPTDAFVLMGGVPQAFPFSMEEVFHYISSDHVLRFELGSNPEFCWKKREHTTVVGLCKSEYIVCGMFNEPTNVVPGTFLDVRVCEYRSNQSKKLFSKKNKIEIESILEVFYEGPNKESVPPLIVYTPRPPYFLPGFDEPVPPKPRRVNEIVGFHMKHPFGSVWFGEFHVKLTFRNGCGLGYTHFVHYVNGKLTETGTGQVIDSVLPDNLCDTTTLHEQELIVENHGGIKDISQTKIVHTANVNTIENNK